jgi:hypothetical protein
MQAKPCDKRPPQQLEDPTATQDVENRWIVMVGWGLGGCCGANASFSYRLSPQLRSRLWSNNATEKRIVQEEIVN